MLSQLETSHSPEPSTFSLDGVVDQAVHQAHLLKENLDKMQTLIDVSISDPWEMTGSHKEIYSLLSNLLSNAIRYCPDGSSVNVSIESIEGNVIIQVSDNGLGIPEEHIQRLTERFYRVDNSHSSTTGGTGLGLSIAKHIVNRHDGDLNIRSHLGSGTVVECRFPASRMNHVVNQKCSD